MCLTLRSRSGEDMRPRKYFCATMFVAVCDQNFGNSTSFCSKTAPSLPGITASRDSQSISANGSRSGIVKNRRTPTFALASATAFTSCSSVIPIHMTPGWETSSWPDDRSLVDNLRDLQAHADDFENRTGFTYTVLDPATGDVIGCVYIYPDDSERHDARVRSWVRASQPELDVQLWRAVTDWLADEWPFERVAYAERPDDASQGVNRFQCPPATTSTVPPTTLMAVS